MTHATEQRTADDIEREIQEFISRTDKDVIITYYIGEKRKYVYTSFEKLPSFFDFVTRKIREYQSLNFMLLNINKIKKV